MDCSLPSSPPPSARYHFWEPAGRQAWKLKMETKISTHKAQSLDMHAVGGLDSMWHHSPWVWVLPVSLWQTSGCWFILREEVRCIHKLVMWITGDSPGRITLMSKLTSLGSLLRVLCKYVPQETLSLDPLGQSFLWGSGEGRKEGHIIQLFEIICKLFLCDLWHVTLQKTPSTFPSIIMWWVSRNLCQVHWRLWLEQGSRTYCRCSRQSLQT